MIKPSYVATMLFLLYGPRLFGSLLVDFTILPIFWLSILYLRSNSNLIIPKSFITIFYTLSVLICSAILISISKQTYDFIHIFKLLRALLGGLIFVLFGWILYLRGLSKEHLIEIFIWAVVSHSLIVIFQFFLQDFAIFINMINGYPGAASRPTGLTWSLNASAIPSAFAIFLILDQKKSHFLKLILIIFSMFLMGRTSFLLMIIIIFVRIFMNMNFKNFMQLGLSILIVSISILPLIEYLLSIEELNIQVFQYLQIAQLLIGQISLEDTVFLAKLLETLQSFIFFPETNTDLLFGSGLSGRESIYIASDMGWILNIFSFGIFGISIFIFLHLYLIFLSYKSSIHIPIIMITVLILLVNFKENLFFVRHVSAVYFFCLVYLSFEKNWFLVKK